jgi:hypothetical protein
MWFQENVWQDWSQSLQDYNSGNLTASDTLNVLEKALLEAYRIYTR